MATVTSENSEKFNKEQMDKKKVPKAPKRSAGEMANKAWSMSSSKFPSREAMEEHRKVAKAYRDENDHQAADRHEAAAMSHVIHMMKNK